MLNPFNIEVPEGLDLSQTRPRSAADRINEQPGKLNELDGIDCPKCLNRGYIAVDLTDGSFTIRDCECKQQRRTLRKLKESGLSDLIKIYNFRNFQTPDAWTGQLKEAAGQYLKSAGAPWFVVCGSPGTGKTHICTAICRRLIQNGAAVRYMLWKEEAPAMKAVANDPAYAARFRELADADVLYIDDMFKGKVTDGDMNLAFALINARYNARSRRTIISSELSLAEISRLDPAIHSRIYERARGFILKAPHDAKNWRTEKEETNA